LFRWKGKARGELGNEGDGVIDEGIKSGSKWCETDEMSCIKLMEEVMGTHSG